MANQPVITMAQISDALGENPGSFRAFRYVAGDQLPAVKIPRGKNGRKIVAHPVDAICAWLRRAMSPGKFGAEQEAALYDAAKANA